MSDVGLLEPGLSIMFLRGGLLIATEILLPSTSVPSIFRTAWEAWASSANSTYARPCRATQQDRVNTSTTDSIHLELAQHLHGQRWLSLAQSGWLLLAKHLDTVLLFTPHLGFSWTIRDQADILDGAMTFADFLQLFFSARERQPRDEDFLFLHGCVVFKHLRGH